MPILTKLSTTNSTQITTPFPKMHKPPSFWQQIKTVCNKILTHTLFNHKPKLKAHNNPIYCPKVPKVIHNDLYQPVNDISKLSSDITHALKSHSEIELDRSAVIPQFKKNIRLINEQKDISYDERKMHLQLNELDKAIRLHPDFASIEGIFRLSGKKADMHLIFLHLDANKPLTQTFIENNNISLPSITLAYKELFGLIMDKQNYPAYFLNKSPDKALEDAYKSQRDIIAFMKEKEVTGEKANNILTQTKNRINRVTPSMPFNILTSLFADIAKNPAAKMNAKNLAICLAPRLLADQFEVPSIESMTLNNRMITFIEALIHTKLYAWSSKKQKTA
nr:RhoGAP domain-containing protein [Providencia rettgeri]